MNAEQLQKGKQLEDAMKNLQKKIDACLKKNGDKPLSFTFKFDGRGSEVTDNGEVSDELWETYFKMLEKRMNALQTEFEAL